MKNFFARQIHWVFEDEDSDFLRDALNNPKYENSKNAKKKNSVVIIDIFKFLLKKCFEDEKGIKLCRNNYILKENVIINRLKDGDLFEEALNLIYSDQSYFILKKLSKGSLKEKIKEKMNKDIVSLLRESSPKIQNKFLSLYKKYASVYVDDMLEIIIKTHIGNKLLIITFFAQEQINKKGFMEELENNYGIYLDVENFIKSMKKKLDEIKNFKQLFNYCKSEFGPKDSSLEIFIKGYKKARQMGYIN